MDKKNLEFFEKKKKINSYIYLLKLFFLINKY